MTGASGSSRQQRKSRTSLGGDAPTHRRSGFQQPPGDEALTAEHLVCTEEERVRLPPSPCPPPMPALPASARDSMIDTFSPHYAPSRKAKRCDGVRRVAAPTTLAPLWCQGQHAPFVRLRRRFDSCRRLSHADVVSIGRAPGRQPGGARSIRAVRFFSRAGPWCNGSIASSNLAGPGSSPGGPASSVARSSRAGAARLSRGQKASGPAVRIRIPTAPHDRDVIKLLLRAETGPVIDSSSTGRGFESRPERSHRSGSSVAEQFRSV